MAQESAERSTVGIAIAWAEACARQDTVAAFAMLSDDFRRFGGADWSCWSKREYEELWHPFIAAFDGYSLQVVSCRGSGDTAYLEMVETATFTRPFAMAGIGSVQPNGRTYVDRICAAVVVDASGQVAEVRAYITSNLADLIGQAIGSAVPGS